MMREAPRTLRRWSWLGSLALLACSPAPVSAPAAPGLAVAAPLPDGAACPEPPLAPSSPIKLHDTVTEWPTALSVSPDSRWLAMIGDDRKVQIRDARTGRLRTSFDAREADLRDDDLHVETLGWASSGQWLAIPFPDRVVHWDIEKGTVARRLRSDVRSPNTAMIMKGGEQVVTLTKTAPQVHRHEVASGAEIEAVAVPTGRGDRTLRLVPEWPEARGVLVASEDHLFVVDGGRAQVVVAPPRSTFDPEAVYVRSPDDRTVLVNDGNSVRLIDTSSRRVVLDQRLEATKVMEEGEDGSEWSLRLRPHEVRTTFSPDGALLAIAFEEFRGGSRWTSLLLVDVPGHRVRFRSRFTEEDIGQVDFLFQRGTLCRVKWSKPRHECLPVNLTTGAQVGSTSSFDEEPRTYRPVSTTSTDRRLRAIVEDWRIVMHETTTRRRLWGVPLGIQLSTPDRLAVSEDGRSVAMVTHEPTWRWQKHPWVHVWWASKGRVKTGTGSAKQAPGEAAEITTAGDQLLVYWRGHNEFRRWLVEQKNPWSPETESPLRMARLSPDGKWQALVDEQGTLSVEAPFEREEAETLSGFQAIDARFTSDSARVVALGSDGAARAWPVKEPRQEGEWPVGDGAKLAMSSKGEAVIHAPASSEVITLGFDPVRVERRGDGVGRPGTVARAFSPDARTVVLAPADGAAVVVDVASGAVRATLTPAEARHEGSVVFHPDGERLATVAAAGGGSVVRVRSARTGQGIVTVPLPGARPEQVTVAFSVGELVIGHQGQVTFHGLDSCKAVAVRLLAHGSGVGWLATDADGHLDGDDWGLRAAMVPGPDGLPVADEEVAKSRVPGLLFGLRAAATE